MEVVPLPLELSGGVHLVCHDSGDGLQDNAHFAINIMFGKLPSPHFPSTPPSFGGACHKLP